MWIRKLVLVMVHTPLQRHYGAVGWNTIALVLVLDFDLMREGAR
jgi:hypothetical protein